MEDYDISLSDLFGILRRQFRLILLTATVVVGLALVYLVTATPVYQAEALVLVDPAQKNILEATEGSRGSAASENARVESEVEILRSAATALAVVEAANLVEDPEFGPSVGNREKLLRAVGFRPSSTATGEALLKQTLNRFINARTVRRKGLTFVLSLQVASEDPDRAAELANTLADVYIQRQVAAKVEASLASRDVLQNQIASAQNQLTLSEDALDAFITDNIARLEAESGSAEIAALRLALDQTAEARLAAEIAAEQARSALNAGDLDALVSSLEDEALAQLDAERAEIEQRLSTVANGSQAEIDLRSALASIESGIDQRANTVLANLQSEISTLDDSLNTTQADLRQTLLQGDLSSETLAEVFTLQQAASISRRQYQTVLSRLSELEAQAAVQIADSRVVSRALPPRSAASPNTRLTLALALVAALGLGVALAFANEYLVGGVVSDKQLANIASGTKVSTTVPLVGRKQDQSSLSELVLTEPLSAYSESFRRLRATIDQTLLRAGRAPDENQALVIVITSSVPAEGKSTSALALARTYALSGSRTLLIDADLRKPSIHRQLNVTPESSFLDYLAASDEEVAPTTFYHRDEAANLSVFLGGRRSNIPTDQLLASTRFADLLRQARSSMDVIVIDTPPLGPVVDARYVAPFADAAVMIVRYGTTTQADVRTSIGVLREAVTPGTPIFTVLNHEERPQKGYKYQGYYADYSGGEPSAEGA